MADLPRPLRSILRDRCQSVSIAALWKQKVVRRDGAFRFSVPALAILAISSATAPTQDSAPAAARAQPVRGCPDCLDDRSTPEALIRSY